MRQTPEEFHDAALLVAYQALITKLPAQLSTSPLDRKELDAQLARGAYHYATALLAHRLPDPAPAQPAQPEQRERWFARKSEINQGIWRFGTGHGAGTFLSGRTGGVQKSVYSLDELDGDSEYIELSPATGQPLEQDKPQPDARAVVEECARSIQDLLNIIHDDLTHERQFDHADAINAARKALADAEGCQ